MKLHFTDFAFSQGDKGSEGIQGDDGPIGAHGMIGEMGARGFTGPRGFPGETANGFAVNKFLEFSYFFRTTWLDRGERNIFLSFLPGNFNFEYFFSIDHWIRRSSRSKR